MFGSTATPFGAQAPAPAFGAAPTPAFGAPAPAFGAAAPAPAFGAPAPAPGGYGGFGAQPAPAPAFGAPAAPTGFGAAPATGAFGAPAGAFGAAPARRAAQRTAGALAGRDSPRPAHTRASLLQEKKCGGQEWQLFFRFSNKPRHTQVHTNRRRWGGVSRTHKRFPPLNQTRPLWQPQFPHAQQPVLAWRLSKARRRRRQAQLPGVLR